MSDSNDPNDENAVDDLLQNAPPPMTINDDPPDGGDDSSDLLGSAPPPSAGIAMPPVSPPLDDLSVRHLRVKDEVERWASENNQTDDPYIVGLTAAIGSRSNLTAFATSNPLDFLPDPEVTSGRLVARISRLLAVLRNVLVFVPVLLTWMAIGKAAEAFSRYTSALQALEGEAPTQANFLQFWESGGVGTPGFSNPLGEEWRLTRIAGLDAALIAGVVALTLLSSAIGAIAAQRLRTANRSADARRTKLAVSILEGLQADRSVDSESLEEALAFALNDLGQAARDVNIAAERLEIASSGVGSLTPKVTELTTEVEKLSDQFSSGVNSSIQGLTTAVSALGSSLDGDLQKFMTDALAGLEDVIENFRKASAGIHFGTQQLRDDLEAIHERLNDLSRGLK